MGDTFAGVSEMRFPLFSSDGRKGVGCAEFPLDERRVDGSGSVPKGGACSSMTSAVFVTVVDILSKIL